MTEHGLRISLALDSLEGLSVGDALGESLSYRYDAARQRSDYSAFRDGTVRYTDDTEMAIGLVGVLELRGWVDQDELARRFAARFMADPDRGYGRMARKILREIAGGADWKTVSPGAFGGGSFGNGAAMRVAPLGAYFADDIQAVSDAARRSAEVTHFHPEGIAGAIAVAVGAAVAASSRSLPLTDAQEAVWEAVLSLVPESEVRRRLERAHSLNSSTAAEVARELGNGAEISAQDTVPFCLWSACRNLNNYREAFVETVEVGGDCDTNCAIVGGIVSAYTGKEGIPSDWLRVRESLHLGGA